METTLFKITFKDGRIYKIFCANKSQKQRLLATKNDDIEISVLENGINTIKQWEQIIK